ncbi:adenylate kinase [Fragilaria crotonensis]|nr:adenylate kinase [Fragilaria crotonensis]
MTRSRWPRMMQFGRALQRICKRIVHSNPQYGPVKMAKIDIADGFYRVWVQLRDILKLGVALPSAHGQAPLIAFPLALPMGWVESPPYFTALTETACDMANALLATQDVQLRHPHRLEVMASTPPASGGGTLTRVATSRAPTPAGLDVSRSRPPPVGAVDVYVDDFLLLAQTKRQQTRVMRAALHAIDGVFRPLQPTDPEHRKEPTSIKKMQQGDACWLPYKRMLGWDIDTRALTLNLPPHRIERLRDVLEWLRPPRKRLSRAKWHRMLGELRSMSPALPGTRGLFSTLQDALSRGDHSRVRLTQHVYDTADDFTTLVDSLAERPTRLTELVPTAPTHIGACDACQVGMGGVWLACDERTPPFVWRQRFAPLVAGALITSDNPRGSLSISDLELAGMIAHKDALASTHDIRERTIWVASDNRAAVSWSTKGSSTSVAARAYLLRLNALHQRHYRYLARHHYIPGPVNSMADDASRRWDMSDDDLLTHLNTAYPQAHSWTMHHLPSAINCALTGALCKRRQPLVSERSASADASWRLWRPSARAYNWTHGPWAQRPHSTAPALCTAIPHRIDRARPPTCPISHSGGCRTAVDRRTPGWGP